MSDRLAALFASSAALPRNAATDHAVEVALAAGATFRRAIADSRARLAATTKLLDLAHAAAREQLLEAHSCVVDDVETLARAEHELAEQEARHIARLGEAARAESGSTRAEHAALSAALAELARVGGVPETRLPWKLRYAFELDPLSNDPNVRVGVFFFLMVVVGGSASICYCFLYIICLHFANLFFFFFLSLFPIKTLLLSQLCPSCAWPDLGPTRRQGHQRPGL